MLKLAPGRSARLAAWLQVEQEVPSIKKDTRGQNQVSIEILAICDVLINPADI